MENYNISLEELLFVNYQEELVCFISDKIDKAPHGTDIYPEYVFGTNSLDLQQNAAWLRAITISMRDYNAPFYPSKSPQEYMEAISEDGDDEALLALGLYISRDKESNKVMNLHLSCFCVLLNKVML